MKHELNARLLRWREAGVIDEPTASRIEAFEARNEGSSGLLWPVVLAIAFGALMVGAGVLLFVAAHWDRLSPTVRFGSVLAMVGFFHLTTEEIARAYLVPAATIAQRIVRAKRTLSTAWWRA